MTSESDEDSRAIGQLLEGARDGMRLGLFIALIGLVTVGLYFIAEVVLSV